MVSSLVFGAIIPLSLGFSGLVMSVVLFCTIAVSILSYHLISGNLLRIGFKSVLANIKAA